MKPEVLYQKDSISYVDLRYPVSHIVFYYEVPKVSVVITITIAYEPLACSKIVYLTLGIFVLA